MSNSDLMELAKWLTTYGISVIRIDYASETILIKLPPTKA
jgi:hypothetical protein